MSLRISDEEILKILQHNQGFDNPVEWIDFARRNNFGKVPARLKLACPDCGCSKNFTVGQYVYYSQLIRLKRCLRCDLRYSDVSIDRTVIERHFEHAYKDRAYFENLRQPVFEHLARLLSKRLPPGATIMDAGGALGHLARILKERDDSYHICISDISQVACDDARKEFNLEAVCCTIEQLGNMQFSLDALLLIDVIYYVDDIRQAWRSISQIVKPGGYVIIRFPNKLWRTDLVQWLKRLMPGPRPETAVHGINSEHVYFFSRQYMKRRLTDLGFQNIGFHPSPTRKTGRKTIDWLLKIIHPFCQCMSIISLGKIIVTPAQLVVARMPPGVRKARS